MPKKFLTRRTMLRGMAGGGAVALGLPILEAMLNSSGTALADGQELPLRFLTWYWGDGMVIDRWEPAQTGATWSLSEQLQPLSNVKDYVSVVSGLRNRAADRVTHHEGMTGFNGYNFQFAGGGGGINTDAGGPTIDQVIADTLGDCTTIRAVHVRVSKRESTDGDGGSTVLAMSHRGQPGNLTPQIPQANPRQVWQTIFGEFQPRPDDRALRTSILDHVRADAASLKTKLGTRDQQRLDAHLEGVRELEQKILATPPSCSLPGEPTEENVDQGGREPITSVNTVMAELIAFAFVCDITRVASFLFKKFVSSTVFDEIGANEIHHNASHNGPTDTQYQAGVVYSMQKFADLLEVFQNTDDGTGDNLLDSSIIYATSDCSTGQSHSIDRQPILLAGRGRGYLVHPGIHYQATAWDGNHQTPSSAGNMSDVLLTCLQAFDPNATSVGAAEPMSTTPLRDVVA